MAAKANMPLLVTDSAGDNRRMIVHSDGKHEIRRLDCPFKLARCNAGCAAFATMPSEGMLEFVCRVSAGGSLVLGYCDPDQYDHDQLLALQHGTDLKNHLAATRDRDIND